MTTTYSATLERKLTEVFDHLEVDSKRALKIVLKEIETRGKKIQQAELMQLRIVKALVLENNYRYSEARDELLGVLNEIKKNNLVDHYVLDTFLKTTSRMQEREHY